MWWLERTTRWRGKTWTRSRDGKEEFWAGYVVTLVTRHEPALITVQGQALQYNYDD